jgi:hypothetical protein
MRWWPEGGGRFQAFWPSVFERVLWCTCWHVNK